MQTALVVTSDARGEQFRQHLEDSKLHVDHAHDANVAQQRLNERQYDLILIDTTSPPVDGWILLRHIRRFSDVPIVLVVGDDSNDAILGLSLGADDCVSYNTRIEVIRARVLALLRRVHQHLPALA